MHLGVCSVDLIQFVVCSYQLQSVQCVGLLQWLVVQGGKERDQGLDNFEISKAHICANFRNSDSIIQHLISGNDQKHISLLLTIIRSISRQFFCQCVTGQYTHYFQVGYFCNSYFP